MCLNMSAHWTCDSVGSPESTTHAANRWVQPIIVAELWRLEVARLGKFLRKFRVFEKSDPLRENFQNFVPERFIATQMDVLCWNFVKFDRREIGKVVVIYLPRNSSGSPAHASTQIALIICRGQPQTIFLDILKIHPNLLTFGGRTREHRQKAL